MRRAGAEISAPSYAYFNFGRDIGDLTAEELESIPSFLLDPWMEEQEKA